MKRVVGDVPRWSCFLHRDARGLGMADVSDVATRKLEDELFERLFSGELELLPEKEWDRRAPWAGQMHATCDQLPDFERLSQECRGDASAAALGVEVLMDQLRPALESNADGQKLRRSVRSAAEKASAAVDELREAQEGLAEVGFGAGTGQGSRSAVDGERFRGLARRLKDDRRLKRIALLAGRFKRIAVAKRRERVKHGADEITDIEQGGDLGRLIPAELVRLRHPRLHLAMLRDLAEQQGMQYALTGAEAKGRGPMVVCLDKSGSMEGKADEWATAVVLALLHIAQVERRMFGLVCFTGEVVHASVVEPGGSLPDQGLFVSCDGGTCIEAALGRALAIIGEHPGQLKKADVVLVTDGQSPPDMAPQMRQRAVGLGVTILGLGIGVSPSALEPWCDEAHAVERLDTLDDTTASALFEGGGDQ